eukprot:1136764-Pelagomonas_calceolata.AAC.10
MSECRIPCCICWAYLSAICACWNKCGLAGRLTVCLSQVNVAAEVARSDRRASKHGSKVTASEMFR